MCDAKMVVWIKQAIMEFYIGVLSIFPYIFINLLYMPNFHQCYQISRYKENHLNHIVSMGLQAPQIPGPFCDVQEFSIVLICECTLSRFSFKKRAL